MSPELKEGEHLDDLQNGFFIIQGEKSFRYGIDAVLLSGYAKVKPGERVLDLGTGTGILPILLAAKTPGKSFTGLEIQQKSADMAQRSVAMNHLEDRISIVQGDIREAVSIFGAASFDVAVSNPPYMIGHHGLTNPDPAVAIARHEILCILKEYRLEPKRMRLVYPFVDKEPNMVLVEACKNGNPRIQVEKPLIVYERPGVYTREIREIYGDGR